jgi:prevent-host-death family protein
MARRKTAWAVAEAKARFSELIDAAVSKGPQTITRHGEGTVVVVSLAEWERKSRRKGNLAEFLAASPLHGSRLEVGRVKHAPRTIRL